MKTIAENLQILKDSTDAIRQAILDKGVEITGGITTYADSISKLPTKDNNVVFYDYDGTILYSYTKNKFLSLTSLPILPSHPGLICQGWNWALEDAKEYVQEYERLNIGATYITDDGKTRLYINLLNDGMSVPLYINQTVENSVIVDWGDGTNTETISGTGNVIFNHTYNKAGSYTISLKVETGDCTLGHNNYDYNVMGIYNTISSGSLYKIEIGSNMSIGTYVFDYCNNLQSITIPNSVTSISDSAFQHCFSLQSVTIPDSVTAIGSQAFGYCNNLQSITIPDSVTEIDEYAFSNCFSLQSVTIPDSVIMIGDSAFNQCYSLQSITIPDSVTEIGSSAFLSCYSLQSIIIPDSITVIGNSAFNQCYSLQSIIIPNSVIAIEDYAFYFCNNLQSITIPNSVIAICGEAFQSCTSLQSIIIPDSVIMIGSQAFSYCNNLQSITIPNSVTSISNSAFQSCYSLQSIIIPNSVTDISNYAFSFCSSIQYYDFTSHTSIPFLYDKNAFSGINAGCEIRVPSALYESWKAATNWSTYADYIVPYEG